MDLFEQICINIGDQGHPGCKWVAKGHPEYNWWQRPPRV